MNFQMRPPRECNESTWMRIPKRRQRKKKERETKKTGGEKRRQKGEEKKKKRIGNRKRIIGKMQAFMRWLVRTSFAWIEQTSYEVSDKRSRFDRFVWIRRGAGWSGSTRFQRKNGDEGSNDLANFSRWISSRGMIDSGEIRRTRIVWYTDWSSFHEVFAKCREQGRFERCFLVSEEIEFRLSTGSRQFSTLRFRENWNLVKFK